MAEEKKSISANEAKKVEKVKVKSKVKYFKTTKFAGTSLVVESKNELHDPTLVKYVNFKVVDDKSDRGYSTPVGYLSTEDAQTIAKCEEIGHIVEIDKAEFDKAVK